jgi:hypothetical protein
MSLVEKLLTYRKTKLTETELQKVIRETDYTPFHHVVKVSASLDRPKLFLTSS